jgi:hypothetical protein
MGMEWWSVEEGNGGRNLKGKWREDSFNWQRLNSPLLCPFNPICVQRGDLCICWGGPAGIAPFSHTKSKEGNPTKNECLLCVNVNVFIETNR